MKSEQQRKLEAKLRSKQIQAKRRPLEESGYVRTQWGSVVTNETRLIDNGHYMKTSAQAGQDYKREQRRAAKKGEKTVVIRIERV